MTVDQSYIGIKGIREGLLITLDREEPYGSLRHALAAELATKEAFLHGSRVALAVGKHLFSRDQLTELQALMARHGLDLWAVLADRDGTREAARELGLATRLPGSNTDLEGNSLAPAGSDESGSESGIEARSGALLLKETLRSGRSIYHEGAVTIIGDVNPGAEVIAAGDVVVWGRLRGLVHAGAMGDQSAVICALELTPTQLRIADQIAIAPEERQRKPIPEAAFIRAGQIVAEPWSSRHGH